MARIKTIGLLTSGGDAPGMNAAIRAVTRAAIYNGWAVKGILRGYEGLIHNQVKDFTTESVSGTINRGGTILRTARSKEFMTEEGRAKAYETIKANAIDALIVIGGNGSLAGAQLFAQEYDIPVVGLPGTIDNDLYGTDTTIQRFEKYKKDGVIMKKKYLNKQITPNEFEKWILDSKK